MKERQRERVCAHEKKELEGKKQCKLEREKEREGAREKGRDRVCARERKKEIV